MCLRRLAMQTTCAIIAYCPDICIYYVADAVYEMKMFMFCVQWWKSSDVLQKFMAAVVDNKNQNIGVFVAKCGEYSATV